MTEKIIKICTIDGLNYPFIGDDFLNIRQPFIICSMCVKYFCPMCRENYSIGHECDNHHYFIDFRCENKSICLDCNNKKIEERKQFLKQRMNDFKFKRLFNK